MLTVPIVVSAQAQGAVVVSRGVVQSTAGKPISGARVNLDGATHAHAITGRTGAFEVTAAPGLYTLSIREAGYTPLVMRDLRIATSGLDIGRLVLAPSPAAMKVIGSAVARERLPFNSTPAALRVFPREAYRDQGQAALATVLNQTPGAVVSRDAWQNAAQPLGPYFGDVRGGLPFETALSIDGDPVALPSSGTFNLAYVPSFVLQDVEIVKGYGSVETTTPNAIDGAINLRTAEPTQPRRALMEVEADSHGGQFSDLAYAGTEPGNRFSFASMFAIDGNPGPDARVDAAGYGLQRAQLLKARYELSPSLDATAMFLGSQGTLGLAVTRGFSSSGAFESLANSPDAAESHDFGLYSLELHADAGIDHLTARGYAMELQRTGSYDAIAFPAVGSGLNALDRVSGFSLQDDHESGDNLYQFQFADTNGSSGASACSNGACTILIPSDARTGTAMLRGAATLHPAALTDVNLSAAGLWFSQRYSQDGGLSYGNATFATGVFHAGAAYHVKPNLTARVSLGTGAAPPPAAVLNANPAAVVLETPVGGSPYAFRQLAPNAIGLEGSFGYDAGVEYRLRGDTTTLSADLYHTIAHGAYVDGSEAGPVWQYQWFNAPAITHEGVELSLQQFKRVGLGFIVQGSFLRTYVNAADPSLYTGALGLYTANLAIVPGVNLTGGTPLVPGYNGVDGVRVPYAQGYGEISYKWPRGSRLSLGALYMGANNPYARPAFMELNSNLELSAGNLSKFQISVENLTNTYGDALPVAFAGQPISLANGAEAPMLGGVLEPRTIRIMFRQSIGAGSLFER